MTEIRGLDGLGALALAGGRDLSARRVGRERSVDRSSRTGDKCAESRVDRREEQRSAQHSCHAREKTHVGPVGGGLCVDGNSSDERADSSEEGLGSHYDDG